MNRELDDFEPSSGHLHTCLADQHHPTGSPCDCAALLFCLAQDLEGQVLGAYESGGRFGAEIHAEASRQIAELIEAGDAIWDGSWTRQAQYERWKAVADRIGGRLTVDQPDTSV